MSEGDKVLFPEGNKVRFFMDHSVYEGVPSIEFTVSGWIRNEVAELYADGYGGGIHGRDGSYGNGSIFVDLETAKKHIVTNGIPT